jgi:subtilisin family serine protease
VIFVTSAGNENSSGPHYPSDYSQTIPGILSVAALSPNNRRAEYSNYSTTVNMSAPGGGGLPLDLDDIYCADLNNTYSYSAGTSLAAPHVVGIIALMLSVNPDLDFSEIKQILEQTAISIQQENFETWRLLGAGKLNAGQALKKVVDNLGVPSSQPGVNTGSTPVTSPIGTQTTGPKIKITFGENGTVNDSNKINQIVQDVTDRVSVEIRQLLQKQRYDQIHTLRITLELNEYTTVIDRAI